MAFNVLECRFPAQVGGDTLVVAFILLLCNHPNVAIRILNAKSLDSGSRSI